MQSIKERLEELQQRRFSPPHPSAQHHRVDIMQRWMVAERIRYFPLRKQIQQLTGVLSLSARLSFCDSFPPFVIVDGPFDLFDTLVALHAMDWNANDDLPDLQKIQTQVGYWMSDQSLHDWTIGEAAAAAEAQRPRTADELDYETACDELEAATLVQNACNP